MSKEYLEETNKEYETLIESYKKSQLEDKAKISEQAETITNLENQVAAKDSKINKLNVEIVTLTKERDKANNTVKTLNEQITVLKVIGCCFILGGVSLLIKK